MKPATIVEILWLLSGYAVLLSPPFVVWAAAKWYSGARPPPREEWRIAGEQLTVWAADDLREDWEAVRKFDAVTVILRAVETAAMLGLLLRFLVHFVAYHVATGDDPDEWALGFGDCVGPRPTWHRLSASLTTAMLVAWFATMFPVGTLNGNVNGVQQTVVIGWLYLNAAAAVCDPVLIAWQPLTRTVSKTHT